MHDIIRHRGGAACLVAAAVIFGLWNTAYKCALSGLPVMTVLAVMLITAAAVLWTVAAVKGHSRVTPSQLRRIAVAGLLDPAISYAAIGIGLTHLAATISAMLDGAEACFVVAFASILARRRPGARAVIGVLLSAAGIAVFGATRSLVGLSPWALLVLAGVASAALCNVLTERVLGDDVETLTLTAYQMGFAALATLPLLGWQWHASRTISGPAAHPAGWAIAVACGMALAAAFLLYNYAIGQVPVSTAGMILNTIPVFGVVAAICFLGERLTWEQATGAAVILIAVFLFDEAQEPAGHNQRRESQPCPGRPPRRA